MNAIEINPDYPKYSKTFKIYGAYIIFHNKTRKMYIGSGNVADRKINHIGTLEKGISKNTELQEAYNDDKNISFHIIQFTNTKEEAFRIEQIFLNYYFNKGLLFNISSDAKKPIYIRSNETKLKLSVALKHRVFSDEHKKNLSLSHTGHKQSEEAKEKNRLASTGRRMTSENYDLAANRFRLFNEKRKKKISFLGVIYNSISECSNNNHISRKIIRDRLKKHDNSCFLV